FMALERFRNADDVLIDDPSRPDVQMSDLGVPHLAGRKSDRESRGFERGPRRVLPQIVKSRRVGLGNSVPFGVFATAESIDDDENEEGALRHGGGQNIRL